jgi:hypothetical protein
MHRTHAQQFANETLPRTVFADPLAVMRLIADDAPRAFAALWEQAGAELAPIARVPGSAITARITRRGLFVTAVITPPIPRATADAALIAIVGRGDGALKMSTVAYYVLELGLDAATGTPRFTLISRTRVGAIETTWRDGPLPDPSWLVDHVFEVYSGRALQPHAGVPELPSWYWWYALGGADAIRVVAEATTDEKRFAAITRAPVLLLPEIADVGELLDDAATARRLRELRRFVNAATWEAAIERLASASTGSAPANVLRAIALIDDAVTTRVLARQRADELEATLRAKLAVLGVDASENIARAEQLAASARVPRIARGSEPPPIATEDPMWRPLFLDDADLPQCARGEQSEWSEPTFLAHGGVRAGCTTWRGDDRSALAQVVDARLVFRTAAGAAAFVGAVAPALGDGLPAVAVHAFGDDTLAFGGDRTQIVVVRVGRVVARLHVQEGAYAATARQILHAATLHPLVAKIVQRVRRGLASYWLDVASPTNAVPALFHSPGYDAARLLAQYPLLAYAELPSAMLALGEQYAPAASALASFQAQLRAHRWATYREAMLALVRALLASDMGNPHVNAAHAHEIVAELRYLDADPIWMQLDAECRARIDR